MALSILTCQEFMGVDTLRKSKMTPQRQGILTLCTGSKSETDASEYRKVKNPSVVESRGKIEVS